MRKTFLLLVGICSLWATLHAQQPCEPGWRPYTSANSGIDGNPVQGLTVDASGKIWVSHGNGGLSVLDPAGNWTHYTAANSGLPSDNCTAITTDLSGNIWLGSFMNIVKFDGTAWTAYNSANGGFTNPQEVREIKADAGNRIWAGTQTGLYMYNGSVWTVYDPTNSGLPVNGIMDFDIAADGKKWIGTQGGGLSVFDGTNWTTYNTGNSGLPHNEAWSIVLDATGHAWIGTWGGGLAKFDGTTWTVYNTSNSGLISDNVRRVRIDGAGKIWCGTGSGISVFDGSTWTSYTTANSPLVSNFIYCMTKGNHHDMVIGGFSENGVTIFTDSCQTACTADTVSITVNICRDQLPYVWNGHTLPAGGTAIDILHLQNTAGCDSLVVLDLLVDTPVWETYVQADGLADNNVRSVALDADGNVWFGTSGGGVSRFDGTTWTTFNNTNSGIGSNYISEAAITPESSGNVWIGTQSNGAVMFDGTNWTSYNTSNSGISSNVVTAISIDNAGNKWFGTYGAGLSKFDGTTWTTYNSASGLASTTTECIAIDQTGRIWVGFGTAGGVSVYNGTGWTTYTTGNSGLPNNGVNGIAVAPTGQIWFATGNGVAVLDGTNWTVYNSSNSGLGNNYTSDVEVSPSGVVWVSTAVGVSKFEAGTWQTYTVSNSGILANICNDVALSENPAGVWVAHSGMGGVSSFLNPCAPACQPTTADDVHTACGSFTWIDDNTYTADNHSATFTLPGSNGCDSTVTLQLTIRPVPVLSAAASVTACDAIDLGDIAIDDANLTNAILAWFSDAACTVPVTDPTNVSTSGAYYVIGTASSCSDTTGVVLNITPSLHPAVNITANTTTACAGQPVTFNAQLTDGGVAPEYRWYKNGTAVGTNAATYGSSSLANGDEVYVSVGIVGACADSSVESNRVTVSITPTVTPQVNITAAPGNAIIPGQWVTFTALATAGGPNPGFVWLKNGVPIAGATGTSYSSNTLQGGDYIRCILHSNAVCALPDSGLSNIIVMTNLAGLEAYENDIAFSVFPNPANDVLNVSMETGQAHGKITFRLTDISGKILLNEQRSIEAGKQAFSLDMAAFPVGVYTLRIDVDGQPAAVRKIMLAR